MSNAACDELAERLLGILTNGEVFRLYTFSYNTDNISKIIRPACNIDENVEVYTPSLSTLYGYRVVICTLSTAGALYGSRIDQSQHNSSHFQYVFVDECASSHETMTLIPIAGNYCNTFTNLYLLLKCSVF